MLRRAHDEQRPQGEGGREHRLAGQLVEHQPVRRVDEQRGRDEERGTRAVRSRCGGPGDDRAGEEHGHQRLGEAAVRNVEGAAVDDRRDRRPEQHRPWQQRVPVEELHVVVQVLVEIPAADERPTDCAQGVHRQSEDEEDDRAAPS